VPELIDVDGPADNVATVTLNRPGGAVAGELCFTGRVVEAPEAKQLGLVSSVVVPRELTAEVARFTDQIVRAPRDVLLRTKAKAIRRAAVVPDATLDL
jgi:enoyl-CoA hydratase/carnithine racemase